MRKEKELRDMIKLLESDIENYQNLHEKALQRGKRELPRYANEFKDSILIFKAQRLMLLWALGEDM